MAGSKRFDDRERREADVRNLRERDRMLAARSSLYERIDLAQVAFVLGPFSSLLTADVQELEVSIVVQHGSARLREHLETLLRQPYRSARCISNSSDGPVCEGKRDDEVVSGLKGSLG
jgi:hypothetical protein